MNLAVVIFSGGLDSTTLLHRVKRDYDAVVGLSFDYGQRHVRELEYAAYWGQRLCSEWQVVDLTALKSLADQSALTSDSIDVPCTHYTEATQKLTVVPNRNMVMLSLAIAKAENIGSSAVFFGPHANDHTIYPDCRPEFVEAIDQAAQLATYHKVRVFAPFVNFTKAGIVMIGQALGVDFARTWSCYEGQEQHCGVCGTCQERREAFQIAKVPDPTQYRS